MKDPFAALDSDFKDLVSGMTEEEIRDKITAVTLNQIELQKAKEDDLDLAQKREAARDAGAIYREGTKMNKLRVLFCHRVLGDKCKDTGSFDPDGDAEAAENAASQTE